MLASGSQTPVWERLSAKLRFALPLGRPETEFREGRSQTGVWERGKRRAAASPHARSEKSTPRARTNPAIALSIVGDWFGDGRQRQGAGTRLPEQCLPAR